MDKKYKSENRETKTRTDERKVNKGSCSQPAGRAATATVEEKKLGAVHYGRLGGSRLNM